ncbi:hypothetical protein [Streptomyces sp. NPDC047014]|uniref:hypothetical protein n=1 Tax=Streptomyces sp. NPDC047014 TaxID=3155736 RepID=UPI0034092FC6
MHPTRTTTRLLLGVACAVSAVSGCVQVSPGPVRPATAPAAGAVPRHEPRSGPGTAPVAVRAPALEALEAGSATAPERAAEAAEPASPSRPAGERAARGGPGGPPVPEAPPVPDIPEPRRAAEAAAGRHEGGRGQGRPDAAVERELMRRLPVRPADVCALGRRHGTWHDDSPEARICAGVQGG